jgi:hypothetical protein
MFKTIHHMKYAIAATLVLAATGAQAQTYTTMPMGGGSSMTTGPGGTYTTMPLGGGWSTTTGPNGFNATTVPMGGGMSVTTINPPMQMQPLPGVHVPGTPYQ